MSRNNILFVTGFPRSGTTWVNRILLDYFDAGFVNEGQFILNYYDRLDMYGDLENPDNLRRLVDDILADPFFDILRKAYRVQMDSSRIFEVMREPSYAGIVYSIFGIIASELGKSLVGNKNPSLGMRLGALNDLFPQSKIIHVIRDGRDCALSHFKLSWGHKNAYAAAKAWSDYVGKACDDGRLLGTQRYMELKYEDLLDSPYETISKMEVFILGSDAGGIASRFLESLEKNRLKGNANKWKSALSKRQQHVFKSVAGLQLREHGYESDVGGAASIPLVARTAYRLHDWTGRNSWHIVRKAFPSISEHLKGSEHLKRRKKKAGNTV